jgi:hypothetical protein
LLLNVSLKVAFDLVSVEDGSSHSIKAYGEALDAGDKATSKAMTAAYKYALLQTFCIPISGSEDADADSHKLRRMSHAPEPVQGWDQWLADISDMLRICETVEAVERVQNSNRHLLQALRMERPELYSEAGKVLAERRIELVQSRNKVPEKVVQRKPRKQQGKKVELEHA